MKKYLVVITLVLLIVALLILPLFFNLITIKTDTERFLINIFITLFSVFLGFKLDGIRNEKKLAEKWMPAAQNAALKLVTLSSHAKDLINSHKKSRQNLKSIFSNDNKEVKMLRSIIDLKCDSCAESMSSLKDSLDTSLKEWETFIDFNCEVPFCVKIHRVINKRKEELGLIGHDHLNENSEINPKRKFNNNEECC